VKGKRCLYPLGVNPEEEEMTSLTRRVVLVSALSIAAFGVAAGSATATRTINVPSAVSIKSNSLHFTGKVSTAAKYEPCEQQRKIVLFKVISGGPDQAVGQATTNNKGAWSITPQGSAGISLASFYAKAKQLSQGTAGTIYVCKAGKSKTIKPTT
jgi:hypothetical protein